MADKLAFYLVSQSSPEPTTKPKAFVLLPMAVTVSATAYLLMAAICSDAQHTAMLAQYTQPRGWTGSVGDARRALRNNEFTNWWWLFEWFASVQGVIEGGNYRNF